MWGTGQRIPGTVGVKMVNYRRTYTQEAMNNREFKNVYDFEFTNDFPPQNGQSLNNLSFFLFDRMMLRISLNPFAVLRMELDTSISDLLAGIGSGSAGGGATGIGSVIGSVIGGVGGGGALGGGGGLFGPLLGAFTSMITAKISGETSDVHGALDDIDAQEDPNEQFGDGGDAQ
jgi:hypothetical protein